MVQSNTTNSLQASSKSLLGSDTLNEDAAAFESTESESSSSSSSSSSSTQTEYVTLLPPNVGKLASDPFLLANLPPQIFFMYITGMLDNIQAAIPPEIRRLIMNSEAYASRDRHPITTEHVANILREHDSTDIFKACICGKQCVIYSNFHFIPISYLSPDEYDEAIKKQKVLDEERPCYGCYLRFSELHYYGVASGITDPSIVKFNIPFYHIANSAGGYKPEALLDFVTDDSVCTIPPSTLAIMHLNIPQKPSRGVTYPIRHFRGNEYRLELRNVEVRKDVWKTLRFLVESHDLFYLEPSNTKDSLRKVYSFFTFEHSIEKLPSTFEILRFIFSVNNHKSQIGLARLRGINNRSSTCVTVMAYMGWRDTLHFHHGKPNGFIPFEFDHIFCPDIAQTAEHLEDLLAGGRIHLDYLRDNTNSILNYPVDFDAPVDFFRTQIKGYTPEQRLRLAWVLRARVLVSLMTVYPNATENHDAIIHPRLKIFHEWQINQYNNGSDLRTPDSFNPIHFVSFSLDHAFIKIVRTPLRKDVPMDICCENYPEYDWLFTDFKELRDHVRSERMPPDIIERYWKISRENTMFDLFRFIPEIERTDKVAREYSILWCVHTRLNVALLLERVEEQKLNEIDNNPNHPDYKTTMKRIYNLRLFCNTHLNLVHTMLDWNAYSDAALACPVKHLPPHKYVNVLLSLYEYSYPYSEFCIHEGVLPDLTSVLIHVNFMNQFYCTSMSYSDGRISTEISELSDFPNSDILSPLVNLFRRLSPHIAQGDDLITKHLQGIETNVSYLNFTRIVFRVFCLGAYKHARERPSFQKALEINKHLGRNFNPQLFVELNRRIPKIILLAMAEVVIFYTRLAPVYREHIISRIPDWEEHEEYIICVADSVRKRWGVNGEKMVDIMKDGDFNLVIPSPRSEFSCAFGENRVQPIRVICAMIKQMDIIHPKRSEPVPGNIRMYIFHLIQSIPPGDMVNVTILLDKLNLDLIPKRPFISLATLHKIFKLVEYANSTYTNGVNRDIMNCNFVALLKGIPAKQWSILRLFFTFLASHLNITTYQLSAQMEHDQKQAIVNRYGDITPVCSSMLYAMCCNRICTFNAHECVHTFMGHDLVSISSETNSIRCNSKTHTNESRCSKRKEKNIYQTLLTATNRRSGEKMAKVLTAILSNDDDAQQRVRRDKSTDNPKCNEIPVLMTSLPGKIIEVAESDRGDVTVGDKTKREALTVFYPQRFRSNTICTHCGSMCAFWNRLYGPNGYVCNVCVRVQWMMFMTPFCSACGNHVDVKDSNKENKKKTINFFYVIDDRPSWGTMKHAFMHICLRCKETNNQQFDQEWIESYTRLKSSKHSKNCKNDFRNYVQGFVNIFNPYACTTYLKEQLERQNKPVFKRKKRVRTE